MKKLMILFCLLSPIAMSGEPLSKISLDEALERAAKENKMVMVDFYKPWCNPCQKMDTFTWTDDNVLQFLDENTVSIKINTETNPQLVERFNLRHDSTIVFLRADGSVIKKIRGSQSSRQFLSKAGKLVKKERREMLAAKRASSATNQSR